MEGLGRGLGFGLPLEIGLLLLGLGKLDFLELLIGLSAGLGSFGVSGRAPFRRAYGSAVFGRVSSGRLGRRTGPDMSDPATGAVEEEVVASLRLVAAADGGRAAPFEALEGTRLWLFGADLSGEKVDIAELGRSGARLVTICFFCAAIISLRLDLLAVCDDLRSGLDPLLLEIDDEREDMFGLPLSFSSSCWDLESRAAMMLQIVRVS